MFVLVLAGFLGFSPLYLYSDTRSAHIDMNLIIDGSVALSGVIDEVKVWVSDTLDQILVPGDRITVWSAGEAAKVIYSETITNDTDKENVKKFIQGFSANGEDTDFSGALQEAASRPSGSNIIYTLLISASTAALSPTLLGPQANLMRFSKVEEFRGWQTLVVGLNFDSKVRQAAAAFMGS